MSLPWVIALAVLFLGAQCAVVCRVRRDRRLLDQRLADSEALFRGLIEQSIAGVCIARNGLVTYVNPRAAEIMGCSASDLLGKPVLDFIAPDDREDSARILDALARGESPRYAGSLRTVRPDGGEIEFDVQANPVTVQGAPAVVGILQDVSERRRLERERMAALQLLASIAASSGDAIYAKDLQGRYTLFNEQCARLTGRTVAEALGSDDASLFPPERVATLVARDRLILEGQRQLRYESQLPTPEGLRIMDTVKGPLFDKEGRVTGIFGVTRDITQRKAQELALEESRAQLESVINGLEEGLIVLNPNGDILRMNPAAARINGSAGVDEKGLSRQVMRERMAFETLDGSPVRFEDWPSARLLRGESLQGLELVLRRLDREWMRIVSYNGGSVRTADGGLGFALLTFTDITPRKRSEAALVQAQRLESLGTLAAGIAHDFNNILLAISGNANLASAELPPDHPARSSIAEVVRAGRRATDLVRRILLFANAEEATRKVGDIRSVVIEALELMRPMLPARIRLTSSCPDTVLPVNMDASQLHQVVVNLVTNATHAIDDDETGRAGQITVTLDTIDVPAQRFGGRDLPAGRYARLVMVDDGCGMDAAVLSRIFDPFFTTKAVGRGTGLGLPIVHGIVLEHGGALELRSRPGEGTRVEVHLPLSNAPLPAASEAPIVVHGAGRRVLYIDDERALVDLVTRHLRRLGYQVTGSSDPLAALKEFSADPEQFDLVVTDLSMPEMSGFDVAREVRAHSASVPVIMMSGFLRPADRERAAALGVREVLLKPATVDELGQAIDRQLH